jgi:hypothetical protein
VYNTAILIVIVTGTAIYKHNTSETTMIRLFF